MSEVLAAMQSWANQQWDQHGDVAPMRGILMVAGIEPEDLRIIHDNLEVLGGELTEDPQPIDYFVLGLLTGLELQQMRSGSDG